MKLPRKLTVVAVVAQVFLAATCISGTETDTSQRSFTETLGAKIMTQRNEQQDVFLKIEKALDSNIDYNGGVPANSQTVANYLNHLRSIGSEDALDLTDSNIFSRSVGHLIESNENVIGLIQLAMWFSYIGENWRIDIRVAPDSTPTLAYLMEWKDFVGEYPEDNQLLSMIEEAGVLDTTSEVYKTFKYIKDPVEQRNLVSEIIAQNDGEQVFRTSLRWWYHKGKIQIEEVKSGFLRGESLASPLQKSVQVLKILIDSCKDFRYFCDYVENNFDAFLLEIPNEIDLDLN